MKLYEYTDAIRDVIERGFCFDGDTGEVMFDRENLDELRASYEDKLEACALYVKDLQAEAEAIRAEEKRLKERRKAKESKAEHMRAYILANMQGKSFETARVQARSRASERVQVELERLPAEYVTVKETKSADKLAIKRALQSGEDVPGAFLERHATLTVG
jgi:chromosome segregation ATPase